MDLDEKVISQIVETVVKRLSESGTEIAASDGILEGEPHINDGVFKDIEKCIEAACIAQKKLVALPLTVRQGIIQALRDVSPDEFNRYSLDLPDTVAMRTEHVVTEIARVQSASPARNAVRAD